MLPEADGVYAWISDKEAAQVREIRESLTPEERAQLESEPEDIRSDLMLCRFLRGHGATVRGAVGALRAHLLYRNRHRATLERARAILKKDAEDYRAERTLFAAKLNSKLVQLQLPPWQGTNDGMCVSLAVARFADLNAFTEVPEHILVEWFMSALEQRSLTLHNQSMRMRCMAKVVEVRDSMGFSFSQLLARPSTLMKMKRVFSVAELYPELLGHVLFFNISSGVRSLKMIMSLWGKFQEKVRLCECGDWQSSVCELNTMSPAALPAWTRHVAEHDEGCGAGWNLLAAGRPLAVFAVAVAGGERCQWRISRATPSDAEQAGTVRVCALFFESGQNPPTAVPHGRPQLIGGTAAEASCCGTFSSPSAGVLLVEARLQGEGSAAVAVTFPTKDGFHEKPSALKAIRTASKTKRPSRCLAMWAALQILVPICLASTLLTSFPAFVQVQAAS